jgi:hypothetical protein
MAYCIGAQPADSQTQKRTRNLFVKLTGFAWVLGHNPRVCQGKAPLRLELVPLAKSWQPGLKPLAITTWDSRIGL